MTTTLATLLKKSGLEEEGQIPQVLGYYVITLVVGLLAAATGPTLSRLAAHTQTQLRDISLIFTVRSLGLIIGSSLGGHLYDRVAGQRLLAIALSVIAVIIILIPLVSVFWLLVVLMFFMGVAECIMDVGCNTLLLWSLKDKAAPFINGLHFCFGVGAFLSPLIVAQAILLSGDIVWAYWLFVVPILPLIFMIRRVPSPAPVVAPEEKKNHVGNGLLVSFIMLFLFLYVGAEAGYSGWIHTYIVQRNMASETTAAYLNSAFWVALTLGRLLSIPIATRLKPRDILLYDLLGCLGSMALLLLWPTSLPVFWVGSLALGLFMASIFPTTLALAERRIHITSQITGKFFIGSSLGAMGLPWLIGQLFTPLGPQVMLASVGVDLLVAFGVWAILIRLSRT
ncbi:MAG: MFS transporter [Anaerolineae bacterium]|nr:MFS transporter [Anaerolineae bacterium]